jgi:hypothetical protein
MYLRSLLSILIVTLAIPAIVVAFADPYRFWHDAGVAKGLYSENQRYQIPGLIRKFIECADCEDAVVVVGTSLSENTTLEHVRAASGNENVVRLIAHGSYPVEHELFLQRALASGNVSVVYWELYRNFVRDDFDRFPGKNVFPKYMYNNDWQDDHSYLLNHNVVADSISLLFDSTGWSDDLNGINSWEQTALDKDRYRSWSSEEMINILEARAVERATQWAGSSPDWSQSVPVFDRVIAPLVAQYPDVEFVFFAPPVSLLRHGGDIGESLSRQMVLRKQLAELGEDHANVTLFAFDHYYSIVSDMAYYKDSGHFAQAISRWMFERMAARDPRFIITTDNVVEHADWLWGQAISHKPYSSCAQQADQCGVFDPAAH